MTINGFALILRADPVVDNGYFSSKRNQLAIKSVSKCFMETVDVIVRSKQDIEDALQRFKDRKIDLLYLEGHGYQDRESIRLSQDHFLEIRDLESSWFENIDKIVLHSCYVGKKFAKQICEISPKDITVMGSSEKIYKILVRVFNNKPYISFSNRGYDSNCLMESFFHNITFMYTNENLSEDYSAKKNELVNYIEKNEMEKASKLFKEMGKYFFSFKMPFQEAQKNLEIAEMILNYYYENNNFNEAYFFLILFVHLTLIMQIYENDELNNRCADLIKNKQSEFFTRNIKNFLSKKKPELLEKYFFNFLDGYLHIKDYKNAESLLALLDFDKISVILQGYYSRMDSSLKMKHQGVAFKNEIFLKLLKIYSLSHNDFKEAIFENILNYLKTYQTLVDCTQFISGINDENSEMMVQAFIKKIIEANYLERFVFEVQQIKSSETKEKYYGRIVECCRVLNRPIEAHKYAVKISNMEQKSAQLLLNLQFFYPCPRHDENGGEGEGSEESSNKRRALV